MSSSEKSSPVAPAVENTLGLFAGEDEVARGVNGQLSSYHVFSYRHDFEYLWGIGGHDGNSLTQDVEGECSVVLIYDGIPEGSGNPMGPNIDVAPYITAYDWAVHFFLSSVAGNQIPRVRLSILDVTPQQSEPPFAAKRIPGLLPLMPWLRVYRLFDDLTDLQTRSGHFGIGFTEMAATLIGRDRVTLGATDRDVMKAAEERIREAWVNNLTKPEGRHAVSNLVAPLVLAGELGRAEEIVREDPQRAALAELLQTLGVIEDYRKSGTRVVKPLKTPLVEKNIFGQFEHVRFLLLDDQAVLGYHDVLASLLYGDEAVRKEVEGKGEFESVLSSSESSGTLQSITSPGPVVESLYEVTGLSKNPEQEVNWSQPRVLDSLVMEGARANEEFDVLLLDLRLFGDPSSDNKSDAEVEFLERLIHFYERSRARKINDDNLKRAVLAAREYIQKESDDSSEDTPELMHLALFPLLISYVDPSLPIVLFSSTRQQAITEALSHRPSIVTSFDKPVVSGYNERTVPHTHIKSLSDAILSALRLHESRCLWKRIAEAEWTHMPVFETKGRGWDERMLDVYNLPDGVSPQDREYGGKTSRRNAGKQKPHIAGEKVTLHDLRRILAKHYIHYIAESRYFDFTTIPWEILNGGLMPRHIVESANLTSPGFNLPEDLSSRNYVGGAIGALRNKKAHGFGRPPRPQEKEKYRPAAMLLFLLFLDFIEGASAPQHREGNLRKMRGYLRARYDHVYDYAPPEEKELSPYHFASDSKVKWLEVTAFTASFAEAKATDSDTGKVFLSGKTVQAINRIVDYLTKKSTRSKFWVGLGSERVDKSTISSWFDPEPDSVTGPLKNQSEEVYFAFVEYNSPEHLLQSLGQRGEWPSDVKIELHDDEG